MAYLEPEAGWFSQWLLANARSMVLTRLTPTLLRALFNVCRHFPVAHATKASAQVTHTHPCALMRDAFIWCFRSPVFTCCSSLRITRLLFPSFCLMLAVVSVSNTVLNLMQVFPSPLDTLIPDYLLVIQSFSILAAVCHYSAGRDRLDEVLGDDVQKERPVTSMGGQHMRKAKITGCVRQQAQAQSASGSSASTRRPRTSTACLLRQTRPGERIHLKGSCLVCS